MFHLLFSQGLSLLTNICRISLCLQNSRGHDQVHQDIDYLYGGWDQDAMQANLGGPGPQEGDRLIDWSGGYNAYYVCPAAYGEFYITRDLSPNIVLFLQQLAEGDGALNTATPSGFNELAMVFPQDVAQNSHLPHPDHPAHFTCSTP